MVHAFNPGTFALVCNQSRLHLTPHGQVTVLNAQDFYAALVTSSQEYFQRLATDEALQRNFRRRLSEADGGAPETFFSMHIVP
jgi:hypothetical protein